MKSNKRQTDSCCINPDWKNTNATCISLHDPVTGCDSVTYSNSCVAAAAGVTSWTDASGNVITKEWDCGNDDCICPEIYNPVCGNDGNTYSNSCFASCAGVDFTPGCCSTDSACESTLCTSYSGIEIYESGDWVNPNDPCDYGTCEDGFFSGVIIDCAEQMGIPCDDGEYYVLEEGQCCSTCESTDCINESCINTDGACTFESNPVTGCNGETYDNPCIARNAGVTSWTNTTGNSTTIGELIEECIYIEKYDHVCGCNGVTYNNSEEAACYNIFNFTQGTCEPLCTSYTGIEIYQSGEWVNPNDPCDFGSCGEDGIFYGVIIDCAEQMGILCDDGEYVLEDGLCCSTCVKNPCETLNAQSEISITLNQGWNMIGFACADDTDAVDAFSAIVDKLIIAKNIDGEVYLPAWEFNGLRNLERGYGYLIKVTEEITGYNVCE